MVWSFLSLACHIQSVKIELLADSRAVRDQVVKRLLDGWDQSKLLREQDHSNRADNGNITRQGLTSCGKVINQQTAGAKFLRQDNRRAFAEAEPCLSVKRDDLV